MNENLIVSLKDIVVEFDGQKVLDGLSLDIHDKEFVTFLGPSGCGKTTTLRVIAGFVTPKSGNVFFDGKDIANMPPYKRPVNTVFQKYALFPHLNVFENVAFGLRLKKMTEDEIRPKVLEMLEIVGLKGFERRSIYQLSGGQQQRVAIARSLILAAISTVICLVMAFPVGYFLSRLRANKQHIMLMLIMLPMWMNFLLRTYAWMTLLEKNGLINKFFSLFGLGPFNMINTSGAVVLGMVYNYLPFMILPIYTAMTKIDDSIIEAAQDLGCNVWHILFRVLVPLTGPGIATGITQVFVPAVSTFIISRMLGGGSNLLIGDLIELQFLGNSYNLNLGSAMSLVLMVIVLLCMSFTSSFDESEMEGVM